MFDKINEKNIVKRCIIINIIIGGDICPIGKNELLFKQGNANCLFHSLLSEFEQADLSVVNLECPFIRKRKPILKNGPILGVDNDCINGFNAAGIDIVNLANNHILDHGPSGLINTLNLCKQKGINTFGAGKNIEEAEKILIKNINGFRIGFLGIAEQEFSITTDKTHGANPLNIIRIVKNIKRNQGKYDYLLVFVHAGVSGYPLPSPGLMETCRFIAEMGANVVICQHSHCPGSYEKYKNSFIIYGQGNLVFDWKSKGNSLWNKGFLIRITISNKKDHNMIIIPHKQSKLFSGAKKMVNEERINFLEEVNQRSANLSDPSFINKEWLKLCNKRKHIYYLGILMGFANYKLIKLINRKFSFVEKIATNKHLLILENYFRTVSHREIIETILEEKRIRR